MCFGLLVCTYVVLPNHYCCLGKLMLVFERFYFPGHTYSFAVSMHETMFTDTIRTYLYASPTDQLLLYKS